MKKTFLVCPVDCLEIIINQRNFKSINFSTSFVGNSYSIDNKTVDKGIGIIKYLRILILFLDLDNTAISNNSSLEIERFNFE